MEFFMIYVSTLDLSTLIDPSNMTHFNYVFIGTLGTAMLLILCDLYLMYRDLPQKRDIGLPMLGALMTYGSYCFYLGCVVFNVNQFNPDETTLLQWKYTTVACTIIGGMFWILEVCRAYRNRNRTQVSPPNPQLYPVVLA